MIEIANKLQAVIAEETQIIDGSKISVNPLQPFATNLTDEKRGRKCLHTDGLRKSLMRLFKP